MEQIKNEIKEKINQVSDLDLSKLYPDSDSVGLWHGFSNAETKKFVDATLQTIQSLSTHMSLLDTVGYNYIQNLSNQLSNFINHFGQVKDLKPEQITTQHHSSLNDLVSLNSTLRNTGIHLELALQPKLKEKLTDLKKASPLLNELIDNEGNLIEAIKQANEWLKTKGKIDEQTIKGQATAFLERAKEHKIGGEKIKRKIFKRTITDYSVNMWLLGAFLFAGVVAFFTYDFIEEVGSISGSGQALIRISSLLVPAYLTVFCANQFLYHKKMYEAYMFKYASLHTMNHLMSTKSEPMQQKILEKGLNVLFSEPSVKDEGRKYDKQIISELLDMLKSQIK